MPPQERKHGHLVISHGLQILSMVTVVRITTRVPAHSAALSMESVTLVVTVSNYLNELRSFLFSTLLLKERGSSFTCK
jgi:non-homologous end joining protein Ku